MVEMAMFNIQRAITPKVDKLEIRFMSHVLYICVKFRENISDGISHGADTNDGSADRWPDTQNFGEYNIIPPPLCGGS